MNSDLTNVKCTIVKKQDHRMSINLEHEDGSNVSQNEINPNGVDIGRDPWPFKYGVDGTKIDVFTWNFNNYSDDMPERYYQQRVFASTYRTFGLIIPKKFSFQRNDGIYSHFRDEFTSDLEVFNDRTSVLAQEYLFHPRNSKMINGLGQWNDNHHFTPFGDHLPAHLVDKVNYTEGQTDNNGNLVRLPTQPMLHINMHEKKHGFGYYHDENSPESIMYPFAKRGYIVSRTSDGKLNYAVNTKAFMWTNDDQKRLTDIYGKRNILMRRLNQLRLRRVRGRTVEDVPYKVAV